jgi:hypothetical protein
MEKKQPIPEEVLLKAVKAMEAIVPGKSKQVYEKELHRFED